MGFTISDITLLAHAACGVLGCLGAIWVFFEAQHATPANRARIRTAAILTAVSMAAAWIFGGYWYVNFYPPEKALILRGPWPFAHNIFMEIKEHLFFATAILAFLLPVASLEKLDANASSRRLVLTLAVLVAFTGLALEGAGAVIEHGAKIALLRGSVKEAGK